MRCCASRVTWLYVPEFPKHELMYIGGLGATAPGVFVPKPAMGNAKPGSGVSRRATVRV